MDYLYKVVRKINKDTYGSVVAENRYNRELVKYPLNKWIMAPAFAAKRGYHILAFDTQVNAVNWLRHFYTSLRPCDLFIFKSEYRDLQIALPMRFISRVITAKQLDGDTSTLLFPEGSVMVKKIKLIEQVPNYPC